VPLPVSSSNPLAVPADQFNADGLAVVFLSGGRYDGDWIVAASTAADGPQLGGFTTEAGAALTELKNDPAYPRPGDRDRVHLAAQPERPPRLAGGRLRVPQ
jgi:hypothetical protein